MHLVTRQIMNVTIAERTRDAASRKMEYIEEEEKDAVRKIEWSDSKGKNEHGI